MEQNFPNIHKTHCFQLLHLSPWIITDFITYFNKGDPKDMGVSHRLGRSPGVGNGNPLWYSYLENFMDRGAWQATVHDVSKSQTQLSDLRAQGTDPSWGLGEELPNEMTQAL